MWLMHYCKWRITVYKKISNFICQWLKHFIYIFIISFFVHIGPVQNIYFHNVYTCTSISFKSTIISHIFLLNRHNLCQPMGLHLEHHMLLAHTNYWILPYCDLLPIIINSKIQYNAMKCLLSQNRYLAHSVRALTTKFYGMTSNPAGGF